MEVLGITGGIGSGKSMVLALLSKQYGYQVLRTDEIAKELMDSEGPCREALLEAFGRRILSEEGGIDRAAYGRLIYGDPEMRRRSDAIVHPAVWKEVEKRLQGIRAEGRRAAVETALPGEEFRRLCDRIWYVFSPRPVRMNRLMGDRGYSFERCLEIMGQQMAEDGYAAYADVVIDNGRSFEETEGQIGELLSEKEVQQREETE